jgi:hypothetical protein
MRAARPAPLLAALLLCGGLLAGCGKGPPSGSAAGGPARKLAPVSPAGAVSVVTRNTTRLGGPDVATDAASVARTVYPGLTTASRPQVVVVVNERDWAAALAASVLAGTPLNAPILYSEGNALPAVSREALEALHPQGAPSLEGAQVIEIGTTAVLPKGYIARSLPNAEPSTIAVAVEHLWASGGSTSPHQVIVAAADAPHTLQMPAAGLAAESGAPILFVAPGHVPIATVALLKSLHRPAIYVIDPANVSRPTLDGLRRLGAVSEIPDSGSGEQTGPSANSIAVARFTDGQFGWGVKEPGHGLVFASALRPLDAPAAAPLSATADYGPLLLLEEPTQIPAGLAKYLGDIKSAAYANSYRYRPAVGSYNRGWLIGDESALSAAVQAEIDSVLEISVTNQPTGESAAPQAE